MRLLGLALLLTALTACTPAMQTVRLAPETPELDGPSGQGALALEVVDVRDDPTVGALERLGEAGAAIRAENDPAYVVKLAAAEALRRKGFRPGLWSDEAEPRLLIEIEALRVDVSAALPRTVDGRAVLHASAWQGGKQYTARAQSRLTDRIATVPSAETSAGYLNDLLKRALGELLDRKLVAFLAAGGTGDD